MTTPDSRHLWRVQLALECKAFDSTGRLVTVPCADPDPLPAGYAVRYCDGSTELAFAASAPDWLVKQVGQYGAAEVVDQPAALVKQLRDAGHGIGVGHFHTYCFGEELSVDQLATAVHDGVEAHSIVVDGQPVARASSSRTNQVAAELWIETDPTHRRHGYATSAARAWAAGVRQAGKVAFYSHLHDNDASAFLARRLGVWPLFEIIAIDLE